MTTVLQVDGLHKSFKGKKVLDNISFEVKKGEIMAILGPNGAGKSTTIRNIMGILYPDEGAIHFHGHEGNEIPRNKIGYLPEERGLYKNVKVMDMLLYLADLKDYPLDRAKERIQFYLKKFDLEGKDRVSVEELSKGMGQKVQFIGSIIHEPDLLILDEPFSGLDPVSQDLFKQEIRQLADQGTAILLSSHQMNLVEEMCDRIFMIQQGKQIIYGSLDDVKTKYANFKCTIHGKNDLTLLEKINDVERIEQEGDVSVLYLTKDIQPNLWLKELPEHLAVQELSINRVSLHEIFIDIALNKRLIMKGSEQHASFHESSKVGS